MTIQREAGGRIVFLCDQRNMAACAGRLVTDEAEFQPAFEKLSRNGWRVFRSGSDWTHCCSRCLVPRAGMTAASIGQASR